jgi:hypothetical protein
MDQARRSHHQITPTNAEAHLDDAALARIIHWRSEVGAG